MDKSETYIRMSNCPEIQGEHKRQVGDWTAHIDEDGKWVAYPVTLVMSCFMGGYDNDVWLPLQHQLQEMLPEFISKSGFVPSLAGHFTDFVCSVDLYPLPFLTFEQWWLAFVMKERWNKTWDGEDWVVA